MTWADGGYAGKLVTWVAGTLRRTLQIVKRPDDLTTNGCPNTTRPTCTGR
ncbi:MAG TPA: hypothetical protein VK599_20295 [Streptosporangiaceae bacterium]|nr:hypothetical protein [Streptosporangiaceae bacterium]